MKEGKVVSLKEAVSWIDDGSVIALGGNILNRCPSAFVREIARQGKRGLEIVKTAGAYDIDLLCAAGCVSKVHAGFVSFENEFGLAPNYRRMVEEGKVEACEHACYTVIAALRATAYGIPFQPVAGLSGSDLPRARGMKRIRNPYGKGAVYVVERLQPDWAIIHVNETDSKGNARIYGPQFEDILMSRAAKNVILTAEHIVEDERLMEHPEMNQIPHFLVRGIVHVPGGAGPCSCYPYYEVDKEGVKRYLEYCSKGVGIKEYLMEVNP